MITTGTHSGRPAFLDGYTRVFGFSSPWWGGGGVASVARKEGARVHGCFYVLTPEEVTSVERLGVRDEGVQPVCYT